MERISERIFYNGLAGKLNVSNIETEMLMKDLVINGWHVNDDPILFTAIAQLVMSGIIKLNIVDTYIGVKFRCVCRNYKYAEFTNIYALIHLDRPNHPYMIESYCAKQIENFVYNIPIDVGKRTFIKLYSKFFLFQKSESFEILDIILHIGIIYFNSSMKF